MIDLETAARRVLSIAEGTGGNDLRFFAELGCAIADLRSALEQGESAGREHAKVFAAEHDRAERAIDLVRMFAIDKHGLDRLVFRAFLRELDGGKPMEEKA